LTAGGGSKFNADSHTIIEATQYCRKHVIRALGQKRSIPKRVNRTRTSRYQPILEILKKVWAASNFLCGKRLKPFMSHLVAALKRHGELKLTKDQEVLLLSASAATIDRLLAKAKRSWLQRSIYYQTRHSS